MLDKNVDIHPECSVCLTCGALFEKHGSSFCCNECYNDRTEDGD